MSAAALMREAQASGIALRMVGGKITAIGPREAVARMIASLRAHKAALAYALQAEAIDATDWHALDGAYNMHHFNCPTCIAAGRGPRYGLRCGGGYGALECLYTGRRLLNRLPTCKQTENITCNAAHGYKVGRYLGAIQYKYGICHPALIDTARHW